MVESSYNSKVLFTVPMSVGQFLINKVLILCTLVVLIIICIHLNDKLKNVDMIDDYYDVDVNIMVSTRFANLSVIDNNRVSKITTLSIMEVISNHTILSARKCGDWRNRYETFHKRLISNSGSSSGTKLLVAVPTMNGNSFSDKLRSTTSSIIGVYNIDRVIR